MLEALKKSWRVFRQGRPGYRFQELHERRNPHGKRRVIFIALGVLLVVGGIATEPVPGPPSNTMILFGIALLAHTTRRGARWLDWTELRLQPLIRWGVGVWRRLSRPWRWTVAGGWGLLMAAAGYGLWRLMR